MRRFRSIWSARLVALVAATMLVACAEEDAGPQFASDPRPTQAATVAVEVATPALLPTAVSPVATPASLTDLLSVRGAVDRVFLALGDTVWAISSAGDASRIFQAPNGASVRAIDPAPSAQQAAVLLGGRSAGQTTAEVVVLDASGQTLARVPDIGEPTATPVPEIGARSQTIDWSPQGNRLLVSVSGTEIIVFDVDRPEEIETLAKNDETGSIIEPRWSPTGESIAFISESDSGRSRSLKLLHPADSTVTDVVLPGQGRLIVDFAWMPDGVSLLFTEGGQPGTAATGIDLWQVDADGKNRKLVASAGTVAPVARITNLSPSPDGRSVAYTVLVPGPAGPKVDSIWIREHESGVGFRVPMPSVASVEDLWWTDQGLAISVITAGSVSGRPPTPALLQLNKDGSIVVLWAAPQTAGTPISGTPSVRPTQEQN